MLEIILLVGIWTTNCIQTQLGGSNRPVNFGYVKETYTIENDATYEFKREWFRDPVCLEPRGTDTETGFLELGELIQGGMFAGTSYQADFSSHQGIDFGAISLNQKKSIKVARGVPNNSMRNTMLSLFEYKKIE